MTWAKDWTIDKSEPASTENLTCLTISSIITQFPFGDAVSPPGTFSTVTSFINSAGISNFRGGSLLMFTNQIFGGLNVTRSAVSQRGFVCGCLRCIFKPGFYAGFFQQGGILIMQDAVNMASTNASGGPGSNAYALAWRLEDTFRFAIIKYSAAFSATIPVEIVLASTVGSDVPTFSQLSTGTFPIQLEWQVCDASVGDTGASFIRIVAQADFSGSGLNFDNLSVFASVIDSSGPFVSSLGEGFFIRDRGGGQVISYQVDSARLTERGPII